MRLALAELESLETIGGGWHADLKYDDGVTRVWLHRTSIEDGEPFARTATVETYDGQCWTTAAIYNAENVTETA